MYEILLAEPFRVPFAEIGELTDWHAWELYIRPEVERQREADDGDGRRGKREKARLPTRQEYIDTGLRLGGDAESLGRAYDKWAATEEGQRHGGDPG